MSELTAKIESLAEEVEALSEETYRAHSRFENRVDKLREQANRLLDYVSKMTHEED